MFNCNTYYIFVYKIAGIFKTPFNRLKGWKDIADFNLVYKKVLR